MQANSSGVTVSSASLINAGQGRMNLSAKLGLKNWAYEPASPVQAHLDAQQLSIGDLLRLAKQNLPVSGNLSAKVDFQGSQLKPSGSGSVQIANARAYGESIEYSPQNFILRMTRSFLRYTFQHRRAQLMPT